MQDDRREFELGWLWYGLLLGVGYLTVGPSAVVRMLLPAWFAYVWAGAFLVGALGGLWGMRAGRSMRGRRRYWGHVAERAGLGLHAAAVSTLGGASVYVWLHTEPFNWRRFPVLALGLVAVWMATAVRRIVRVTATINAMVADDEAGEG